MLIRLSPAPTTFFQIQSSAARRNLSVIFQPCIHHHTPSMLPSSTQSSAWPQVVIAISSMESMRRLAIQVTVEVVKPRIQSHTEEATWAMIVIS